MMSYLELNLQDGFSLYILFILTDPFTEITADIFLYCYNHC